MEAKGQQEPLFKTNSSQDDSFYEAIERPSEVDTSAGGVEMTEEEKEQQQEEWRKELLKLEEEIHTLQSVLSTKVRVASELKRKLGITAMTEFKEDLRSGMKTITDSGAYKKTNDSLTKLNQSITNSQAYQKTGDAFKALGAWSSKKLGDARNSNAFKSMEEKVGGAYTNVKTKVSGSKSDQNFQELQETESPTGGEANGATPTPTSSTLTTDTPQQQPPL